MRRAKCSLCRKIIGEENVTFFRVPQFLPKRQRWIDLTGVDFKISEYVCQDHFTPRDFINGPGESAKRARLQPGAVPSLYIPKELRSKQWRGAAEALPEEQILPDNNKYSASGEGESPAPPCNICNKPCPKGQVSLYSPPRDTTAQARWNAACGMLLKERSRVCERHFREDDFHRFGKRKRLNVNAIPSIFLYGNELTEEKAENEDILFQNVESIDVKSIGIKPNECDEEEFCFPEYLVVTDCNHDFVSKGVQTGLVDDTQTCAFIQLKAEQKIYSVHCFYCDEIFAIWDWAKFVKHIHEQHSNDTNQMSVFLEQSAGSSKKPDGSSKKLPTKRRQSPTPRYSDNLASMTKGAPEFIAVNAMAEELEEAAPPTEDLNENDIEAKEDETSAETIKKKRKCVKDAATSSDEGSDDSLNDSKSEFDESGGNVPDNSRKAPLPCQQILLGDNDHSMVMDFLELWKTYPVLWYYSPVWNDSCFKADVTKLTNQINDKWNLALTDAGMVITLTRIRNWFNHQKKIEIKSLAGGKMTQKEFNKKNFKKTIFQEYFEKCSKFLPTHETRTAYCETCKCLFTDEQHLQEHAKRHKTYCDICKKEYGTTKSYRSHTRIHQAPQLRCEICGKEYLRIHCLTAHMQAHRDERNFVCDKCGKKFVRQKNLKEHTKLRHPDQDNYLKRQPCAICGINFKNWSGLSLHRRRYHMVLEGTNEMLALGIHDDRRKLKKHTYIVDPVTQQRRLVCDDCGNTYVRHGGLIRHMVKEHDFVPLSKRLKIAAQPDDPNIAKTKHTNVSGKGGKGNQSCNTRKRYINKVAKVYDDDDYDGPQGLRLKTAVLPTNPSFVKIKHANISGKASRVNQRRNSIKMYNTKVAKVYDVGDDDDDGGGDEDDDVPLGHRLKAATQPTNRVLLKQNTDNIHDGE